MPNLVTPPEVYYQDDTQLGDYQYISLSSLVNNFISNYIGDDKLLSNVKRFNVLYHMKRGMQEFTYDALKEIRVLELEIGDTLQLQLPIDYVSYVRISWVDSNGHLRPLIKDGRTALAKAYLQDNDFKILFDSDGFPLEAEESDVIGNYSKRNIVSNEDGSSTNSRYGLDPTQDTNGYFNIDKRKGVIFFSSNINSKNIVIEYISDGLEYDAEDIKIHKFAEQALYNYVKYMIIGNKYGVQEYIVNRTKKDYDLSLRNAKIRLIELRGHEAIFLLQGRKKWLK